MTKWITNTDFAQLSPINVFGKQLSFEPKEESAFLNKHILFRRKLELGDFKKAILRISADDYYKLYINGRFICMGPSPSYPQYTYYNETDITKELVNGENTFAVHTYYQGHLNRVFVSGDNLHGLFFELYIDGKLYLSSDESWKTAYHTAYTSLGTYGYLTGDLECYDSSSKEAGFEKPDFDDSSWRNAVENENFRSTHKLYKKAELLDVYEIAPSVIEEKNGGLFIDIGREVCGYITYKACGIKGSEIIIRSGEELLDDGNVRFELRCNCTYEEKHILSGNEDVLEQYDYKGFRYVQLVIPEGCTVNKDSVKIIVRHYPYCETADISSENKKLEKVLRLCADTVKYGVQEICVDCPTREKGQYLGDAGFIGMSHASITGNCDVLEKVLWDFAHSSFICPGLMAVSGCSFNQEIADYSLMYPYFALWCYRKNKNISFLSELYPYIEGLMKYFEGYLTDGTVSNVLEKWNLVDWPMNLRDDYDFELTQPTSAGEHNVIAAYFVGAAQYFEEIRRILGMPPYFDIEVLKKAFYSKYYDEEAGLFKDTPTSKHHSLHSNVLPVLFDIATDAETKKRVIEMIRQKRLLSVNYFAFFILLTLEKEGEYALMRELVCDDGSWTNMINEGATCCFEAWGKDQKWNTSLCHPWMSYPLVFADKMK